MIICVFRKDTQQVIDLVPDGVLRGDLVIGEDHKRWLSDAMQTVEIPDQDTSAFYNDEHNLKNIHLSDLILYTTLEQGQIIDRTTGQTIDRAVHPFSGKNEQLGILRDQLVHILNALGLEPTADFARWNDIAVKAVNDGATKKAAL